MPFISEVVLFISEVELFNSEVVLFISEVVLFNSDSNNKGKYKQYGDLYFQRKDKYDKLAKNLGPISNTSYA